MQNWPDTNETPCWHLHKLVHVETLWCQYSEAHFTDKKMEAETTDVH